MKYDSFYSWEHYYDVHFLKYYAKNIWSNGNGYDDAANNIFIYYAEKQPEYNRYKEHNWG